MTQSVNISLWVLLTCWVIVSRLEKNTSGYRKRSHSNFHLHFCDSLHFLTCSNDCMDLLVWFLGICSIRSLSTVISLDGECVLLMCFTIHWFLGSDQPLTCSFVQDHSFKRYPCPMDPEATDFTWYPQRQRGRGERKRLRRAYYAPLLPSSIFSSFLTYTLLSPSLSPLILSSFWFPRSSTCHLLQPLMVWIALCWRLLLRQGVLTSIKKD